MRCWAALLVMLLPSLATARPCDPYNAPARAQMMGYLRPSAADAAAGYPAPLTRWTDVTVPGTAAVDTLWTQAQPIFNQFCTGSCHQHSWETAPTVARGHLAIIGKLDGNLMPPAGEPQPTQDQKNILKEFVNSDAPVGIPAHTIVGVNVLFKKGSVCVGCHVNDSTAAAPTSTEAKRFNACNNCHGEASYPNWLQFNERENLHRRSYYQAGLTKGEAALLRAMDGTMPPGAAAHNEPGLVGAVGWCDEIINPFRTWLNAGMPN